MPILTRRIEQRFARILVNWLVGSVGPATPVADHPPTHAPTKAPTHSADLERQLQTGDVILVAGRSRFSRLVCRLTNSTWSHVAIYVGPQVDRDPALTIIEADIEAGVRRIALEALSGCSIQVVRASRLPESARAALIEHLRAREGRAYDLAHVIRLAQTLLQAQWPLIGQFGHRAVGRADPGRAICSTLVAHALASAGVPIDARALVAGRWPSHRARRVAEAAATEPLDFVVPGDFARLPGFTAVYDSRASRQPCA